MKILFRILKVLFGLLFLLILTGMILWEVDQQRTDYLEVATLGDEASNSVLITNVNILPMTEDTIYTHTKVLVKDGVIQEVGPNISFANIPILDAQGAYLLPGLIDMHVHVWDNYEWGLYLANGVTAVRNVWGHPMHLRMKEDFNSGLFLNPNFYTSGPKLTGPEFIGDDNLQLFSPEEAKAKVHDYHERGYDFIKTYYGLTPELFDAVREQSLADGMDIIAHPSQKVPYTYHLNEPIRSIEHVEDIVQQPLEYQLDTLKLNQVATDMAQGRTAFCPTLMAYYNIYNMLTDDQILNSEEIVYMNPVIKEVDSKGQYDRWAGTKQQDPGITDRIKAQHDFHLLAIKKLHEAGVPIIAGTDAGIGVTLPGFSIHDELAFYKEAGLSNYDVLKTATVNAAQTHQLMQQMGTIEPGKTANLLLVKQNPLAHLETLRTPERVILRGYQLPKETLSNFTEKAKERKNMLVTLFRYVENMLVEK